MDVEAEAEAEFSENVVSFKSLSESATVAFNRFSDSWINSPKLIFGLSWLGAGETSCWSICFFSAAFFFVGVELLRFLRGDGDPGFQKRVKGNILKVCFGEFNGKVVSWTQY